ncbi:Sec1 family protein [Tritrichomonas foetus]|uniref:Sec1 family protein n=1 Tax=Tritrichomonas foetus TaxID=1144522 RepID=A0A1J4JD60_9EUKA|nr:Sec1 family protein [Tritrichomonas foetus]|eukprot:OHS95611.1 Sec1 family protein [Tritrichomonas foetus]
MTENESVYSIFQSLASDDILNLLQGIAGIPQEGEDPNKSKIILSFLKKNFGFFRRALPSQAFSNENIKSIIFCESISPIEASGKIVGLCLDDSNEVEFALKQFSLLPNFEKYLVMIPRLTTLCQEAIDRSGLKVHVLEYHLEIIPLEKYCFVVPSPKCFMRCFVQDDINDVYTIASSLLKLTLLTGKPDKIYAAGNVSCRVLALLEQLKNQVGSNFGRKDKEFSQLYIIDRSADLLTPLASQFYYGGMLDEAYNVDYGYLNLPSNISLEDTPDQREVLLSDQKDEFFANLRCEDYLNALEQAELVRQEIIGLKQNMDNTSGTLQYSVYARRAKYLVDTKQYLYMHYSLLEDLATIRKPMKDMINFEYSSLLQDIEDIDIVNRLINRRQYWHAIRLFCFASVATRGLSKQTIADFQRRLISKFGFDVVQDLINLEKAGFLTPSLSIMDHFMKSNKPKFNNINTVLKILYKDPPTTPDIEKGYDNYVPILHRLVQAGVNGQWEGETQVSKLMGQMDIPVKVSSLSGNNLNNTLPSDSSLNNLNKATENNSKINKGTEKILVFVIGGVTSTEVQLFRKMGKILFNGKYDFHVGSTSITHGVDLVKSICPFIQSKT